MKGILTMAIAALFVSGSAAFAQSMTETHKSVNYGPDGVEVHHSRTSVYPGAGVAVHRSRTVVEPGMDNGATVRQTTIKQKNGLLGGKTKIHQTEVNPY
jgi:hypothetical protein